MDKGTDSAGPGSAPGQVTDAAGSPAGQCRARRRGPCAGFRARRPTGPIAGPGQDGGGRRAGSYSGNSGRVHGRRERGPFYAALDLGTNNCRLLIAEPAGDAFRVVDSFSRIVRLGEGVAQSGRLGDEAMDRAIGALARLRPKARPATDGARAADRDAGLPDRGERRGVPRPRARRGRARARDRRPAHRGAARRRGLLLAARPGGARRRALRYRRRLVGDRLARPAQAAPPRRADARLGVAAGRRGDARRAARRHRGRRRRCSRRWSTTCAPSSTASTRATR